VKVIDLAVASVIAETLPDYTDDDRNAIAAALSLAIDSCDAALELFRNILKAS